MSSNFLKILRVKNREKGKKRDKLRISYYFSFLHVSMHIGTLPYLCTYSRKFSSSQKGSTTRRVGINIALKILSYVVKYYFWLVSIALVRNFPTWHFFSIPSPNSQCWIKFHIVGRCNWYYLNKQKRPYVCRMGWDLGFCQKLYGFINFFYRLMR